MDECARMACDQQAVALLTFAPQQAKAWLYDLVDANPATGIMLCRRHANATVVPMSWQLVDGRDPSWTPPQPVVMVDEAPTYHRPAARHPEYPAAHTYRRSDGDEPQYPAAHTYRRSDGDEPQYPAAHTYVDRGRPAATEYRNAERLRADFEAGARTGDYPAAPIAEPALPSDMVSRGGEFEALRNDLPITAELYAAPRRPTVRSEGAIPGPDDLLATSLRQRLLPDPSLFELPIEAPAVTPHPSAR